MNAATATACGGLMVLLAIGLASRTPHSRHEATVDRPTIVQSRTKRPPAEIAPGTFDGDVLERLGGRRWLIMRTGGHWQ